MLIEKQVKEIREHLEKSQNPVFFFDNDSDGLCSFLLLQRYIGRGRGVPIKSFPELSKEYIRKVNELNADYIFILDKPLVSVEFFKEIEQINIPIVCIDHHEIQEKIPEFVNYYNPIYNKTKGNEPTTFLCYQISQKKEDIWIAVVGCVSDRFVPEFYGEFEKRYADLSIENGQKQGEIKNAFDILYNSNIGKIAKIFSHGLKDRTTNVINMLKFLMKVKTPYDVLEESNRNYSMHQRFIQIERRYRKLIEKAKENFDDKKRLLFFQYGGDLSISGDLANELSYLFPEKVVVVIYIKGIKANISARGKNVREIILNSIKGFEGASGGGHEEAVGAQIKVEDIEIFRKNLTELVDWRM